MPWGGKGEQQPERHEEGCKPLTSNQLGRFERAGSGCLAQAAWPRLLSLLLACLLEGFPHYGYALYPKTLTSNQLGRFERAGSGCLAQAAWPRLLSLLLACLLEGFPHYGYALYPKTLTSNQ